MKTIATFDDWMDFCQRRKIDPKDHEWIVPITIRIRRDLFTDTRKRALRYDPRKPN